MPPRFYIWPRYALEVDGKRLAFPDRPGAALARLFSAKGHFVSREDMIEAVYSDDEDGGPLCADECIKVTICRVRKLLAKLNVRIVGWRGESGYRMVFGNDPYGADYIEPLVGHHGPYTYKTTEAVEADSCSVGQFLEKFGDW